MFRKTGLILFMVLFVIAAVISGGCGGKQQAEGPKTPVETPKVEDKGEIPQVLRVGLIPNQAPDKIKAQYEPFRVYMEGKLGMPVELFVATDYAGVVEAIANDKLDLAYFGALTYLQAKQKVDVYPIVTEIDRTTKTTKYHSLIIAPADSPLQSIADIKGKVFAFGDINSTSGSLYPRIMLDKAGIKVPDDLANVIYTGGHDATAMAVQNGTVDAGGIEGRILARLEKKGTVDMSKIKIIAESEPIEGYPWVVRAKLEKAFVNKLVEAFLAIDNPELLDLMRAEKYAPVSAADYEYAEQEAIRLGLLKTKQ